MPDVKVTVGLLLLLQTICIDRDVSDTHCPLPPGACCKIVLDQVTAENPRLRVH